MMAKDMTMERLTQLLDAYGAAPSRWPADERDAAGAMIAASDTAREAFAEAARLDAMLDQAAPPPPADRLAWRLRGIGPRSEPVKIETTIARRGFAVAFARAAVIALALVGGVGIGLSLPERAATVEIAEEASETGAVENLPLALFESETEEDGGAVMLASFDNDDDTGIPLQ
jgi:hypothetical protein